MFRLLRLGPHCPPALPRSAVSRSALPAAAFHAPGNQQRSGRPLLVPPHPCWVTLRAAAGSTAKDAGSPGKAATDLSGENKKLNKSQQLKQVFKQYGAVGVSFHVGISLISLGIFYVAVSSGVDMTPVLIKLGFSESSLQSKMAAGTSTFVLAYAIHKLFAPVRISITVVSVPFVVRYCRKIGFFKPPAPKP
ncbi:protein FAM210B, mitochondrial [Coturnix japonica]|uniref:Family with sequence similarity 210 member B n=1 Tax=Coturnix japonica TaxID=93934 RepID=A0A8C2T793_COTJA|nr:protein FAM210B, mitochondrial [Coturnix japonica]